ncbi:Protein zer-1 homolog [Caenorhabditis elegans]|uniref:Protein zer-1 homolog n=2 Tax=Caenorhabditis elegans TaxID=6239 RepID=G5EC58_CAEEL|nr:Protein zer-1 homolog [Caenorhabditis elegans]CAB82004.2 Protein zer-1 homolog [Caenorhabditis elegans]|eukprot:NP_001040708.1 Uncharacterized protein CELE_Y71A12B.12 [Caenorhabditis elegans]
MADTLVHQAAAAVAKQIDAGHYNSKQYVFDIASSNEVYAQLLKLNATWSYNIDQKLNGVCFILTKVNFENVKMFPETFDQLANQCLKSFVICDEFKVIGPAIDGNRKRQREEFLLTRSLSHIFETSQIDHLDLSGMTSYSCSWLAETGQQLPWLRSLALCGLKFYKTEFSKIFPSFVNLDCLDISYSNVSNLQGISNLQNLRQLSLRGLEFKRAQDLEELFTLKHLNVLDMSIRLKNALQTNIRVFLSCNKVLPELRFLDLSGNKMDEDQLEELLESHSHLHKIAIYGCGVKAPKNCPIQISYTTTYESTIFAIKHMLRLRRRAELQSCFQDLHSHLKDYHEMGKLYDVERCVYLAVQSMKHLPSMPIFADRLLMDAYYFFYEADCLAEIVIHHSHRVRQDDISFICKELFKNVGRNLTANVRTERICNAIISLFSKGASLDKSRLQELALNCMHALESTDQAAHDLATRILGSCLNESNLEVMFSIGDVNPTAKPVGLNFLNAVVRRDDVEICKLVAEKVSMRTYNKKEKCMQYINHGAMDVLISALGRFDSEPLHIAILGIVRDLVVMAPYNTLPKIFTFIQFRTFQVLLKTWTSDRAYLVLSILALRLNHSDSSTECVFKKCADELLKKQFPYLLATKISVDVDIYFTNGIVQNILQVSDDVGLTLWALLTIKIFAQKSPQSSQTIRNSNFFHFIQKPRILSEAVNMASENVRFLFNW